MPDIYDQELDGISEAEDTQEAKAEPKESEVASKKVEESAAKEPIKTTEDKGVRLSEDEYAAFKSMQQKEVLKGLESDFKKKYPDFNMTKVADKILELDAQNPGVAQMYFNEVGLENIYLTHFKGKSVETEDEFDVGRGAGGGISMDERVARINDGSASYEEKMAFYNKFF